MSAKDDVKAAFVEFLRASAGGRAVGGGDSLPGSFQGVRITPFRKSKDEQPPAPPVAAGTNLSALGGAGMSPGIPPQPPGSGDVPDPEDGLSHTDPFGARTGGEAPQLLARLGAIQGSQPTGIPMNVSSEETDPRLR